MKPEIVRKKIYTFQKEPENIVHHIFHYLVFPPRAALQVNSLCWRIRSASGRQNLLQSNWVLADDGK